MKHEIDLPEWIAVTDKTPNPEDHVLACYLDDNDDRGVSIGVRYFNSDGWNSYHSNTNWDEEVTHWMPLPEVPKKTAPATMIERIEAEYGEYMVKELNFYKSGLLRMGLCRNLHIQAQSMRGFWTYVYHDKEDDLFYQESRPFNGAHPIAVLFTK